MIVNTVNSKIFARVYFRKTSHMRSFVKIKSSRTGEITLSFTSEGKPCHSRNFLRRKYVLMLFVKMKFSRNFSEFTVLCWLKTFAKGSL